MLGPVQAHGRGFEECLNRQSGLAPTGHARDADKLAQREIDSHIFQVVARGLHHRHGLPVARPTFGRNADFPRTGQVLACDRVFVIGYLFRRTVADHLTAVDARAGTDVKDVVGLADRVLVMFHHDHRIALIPQVFQRGQKPVVVALVQTNRRFVQNIENARQARADLAGQTDTLAFTARQSACIPRQCQILKPHVVQEPKAFANFLQDRAGDFVLLFAQRLWHALRPSVGILDRHLDHLPHMQAADFHRQRFFPQAVATTGAASTVVLEAFKFFANPA